MNNWHTGGKCALIGVTFLLSLAAPVFSQQIPGPPPIDRRTDPDRARQQDMSKREWQLRNFGHEPGVVSDRRQREALMLQTEQDFNRILFLHNQIARVVSADQALDYNFVSEAAAEIRKRASRLQSTLALRKADADQDNARKWDALRDPSLKDELIALCKQIKSFVTNPVIETPGTVNAEQLKRASRDLADIVSLSAHIKKDADKLAKPVK